MAWFDPRAYGRAASTRAGKMLVLGASVATVVGLSVLVTGGFAQPADESSAIVAQAKKRGFVLACTQRSGHNQSKGDLNIRLRAFCAKGQKPLKLALFPAARGPQGPEGPQGPPGNAANAEFGVANVFVSRGGGVRTSRAIYSVPLGSPAGTTTGGQFRFSCSEPPCEVSFGAAVISTRDGESRVHPEIIITKEATGGDPMTFCEHADGATNNRAFHDIPRVASLNDATSAMRTKLSMGVGGSLDCGAGPQPAPERVNEISVPSGRSGPGDPAFYNVSVTLQFK
jgi:hypothetical protein